MQTAAASTTLLPELVLHVDAQQAAGGTAAAAALKLAHVSGSLQASLAHPAAVSTLALPPLPLSSIWEECRLMQTGACIFRVRDNGTTCQAAAVLALWLDGIPSQ